ncbi:MAG: hypothetical protein Q4A40_06265 [Bacillota bacterium]|nr:hypothetical protein [Bacillota bacterium]
MDKHALNEKRRETVTSLLKGMDIKTVAGGGLEKEDVLDCLQRVCNLYESHIEELEKNYEAELSELARRYQKYDENNDLYVSLIMDAKKSSKEIIDQATREVDEILASGREKIELQEKELRQLKEDTDKEKVSLAAEVKASKDYADAEKAAMRLEIEAEREKLEATKNKYRQQITAMEGEFSEIRTNILRTSARLDALKAQSEDETLETNWDVKDAFGEVQVPDADIEVDQVLEFEPAAAETAGGVNEALASDEAFEETFFKSDVLSELPGAEATAAEPAVPAAEIPAVTPAAAVPAMGEAGEMPAATPVGEMPAAPPMTEAAAAKAEEITVEDLLASMDVPADETPAAESVAEEATAAEPAVPAAEIPAATPAAAAPAMEAAGGMPAAAPVAETSAAEEAALEEPDIEALLDELSFDDVLEEETVETGGEEPDEIDIGVLEGLANPDTEEAMPAEEVPAEAGSAAAEEISFEKLEELFKDEK